MKNQFIATVSRLLNGTRSAFLSVSTLALVGLSVTAAVNAEELTQDGLYVRGSHPDADILGESYMVFTVQNGSVVGGFYQLQSSFDCFHGSLGRDLMPLTVIDSYSGESVQYAMNLSEDTIVANTSQSAVVPRDPVGAYPVADITEVARGVLATCQNSLEGASQI
ncbi:MAG: hypothetical protein ACFB9N_03535 [Geitlerinemataceae cyanobacterium]